MLEKVQRNSTTTHHLRVNGFSYMSLPRSSHRNQDLGLHSLESRRISNIACVVSKMLSGILKTGESGQNSIELHSQELELAP